MKPVFMNLLLFLKLPHYFISKVYNFLILRAYDITYTSYPLISGRILIKGNGKIRLGSNITINSSLNSNPVGLATQTVIFAYPDAEIVIGDNTGISTSLLCAMKSIIIEDGVRIGGGSQIFDNDFHAIKYLERIENPDVNIKIMPVRIKKGAFIGCNSIIGKGVIIGCRSIVAAGSVVVKNIPDDEIWGGNPAVFIKKIDN